MANPMEANKNNPDVQPLWAWNDETVQFAERAYRSWLQGAETFQTQALEFWNAELHKSIEAMNEMARCQTAAEAFGVQTRYATEAIQDFLVESGKVVDQLVTLGVTAWGAAPPHAGGDTQAAAAPRKRATRRA